VLKIVHVTYNLCFCIIEQLAVCVFVNLPNIVTVQPRETVDCYPLFPQQISLRRLVDLWGPIHMVSSYPREGYAHIPPFLKRGLN
jgi:hypothetical protein